MVLEFVASATEAASDTMESPVTTARVRRSVGHVEGAEERRSTSSDEGVQGARPSSAVVSGQSSATDHAIEPLEDCRSATSGWAGTAGWSTMCSMGGQVKLEIWRNQRDVQGLLGGHKGVDFTLIVRVQITEEERGLIEKYRVADNVVATYRLPSAPNPDFDFPITVRELLNGHTINMRSISSMIRLEKEIRAGCSNLKDWLAVMRTFGGYETIEI